jgi:hypothetical protein
MKTNATKQAIPPAIRIRGSTYKTFRSHARIFRNRRILDNFLLLPNIFHPLIYVDFFMLSIAFLEVILAFDLIDNAIQLFRFFLAELHIEYGYPAVEQAIAVSVTMAWRCPEGKW